MNLLYTAVSVPPTLTPQLFFSVIIQYSETVRVRTKIAKIENWQDLKNTSIGNVLHR